MKKYIGNFVINLMVFIMFLIGIAFILHKYPLFISIFLALIIVVVLELILFGVGRLLLKLKKSKIILNLCITLLISSVVSPSILPAIENYEEKVTIQSRDLLTKTIDEYLVDKKCLPNDLQELFNNGITVPQRTFSLVGNDMSFKYRKIDANEYEIIYNVGMVQYCYNSISRKWEDSYVLFI